jgi:hypothetical protein
MTALFPDTDPKAEAVLIRLLRQAPPWRKLEVVGVFERLQIPYFIGGSMASALHGVARSMLDADMVTEIPLTQVGTLVKALGNDFYADEEMIRDAIRHHSSFNYKWAAELNVADMLQRALKESE